jgi:hypothetical protein
MPSGSKLWRWKYRLGGKENRYAIEPYPDVTLKEAANACNEACQQVKSGIHPSHQRELDRITQGLERDNTFEAIAKEWLALKD